MPSFEYYLATQLGGMTVAEMRARMSNLEFIDWQIYYARIAQQQELESAKLKT